MVNYNPPPRSQAANKPRPWHWTRAPEGVGAWSPPPGSSTNPQRVWHAPRHDGLAERRPSAPTDLASRRCLRHARIGPVALGGIRLAKDPAALDPLTPTWPVPTGASRWIRGRSRSCPTRRKSRAKTSRPAFTVDSRNVALGASQTAVVVRDAYGRQTAVSTARLYVAPTLLRPGLSAWEIAAGQVREDETATARPASARRGPRASTTAGPSEPVVRWTRTARATSPWVPPGPRAPGACSTGGGALKRRRDALGCCLRLPRATFGLRLEHEENDGFWRLQIETALPIASRTQASVSYRPDRRFTLRGIYSAIDTGRSSLAFASWA